MFSKLAAVFVSTLALASQVSASQPPASQCNTGALSCCNSVQDASSPDMTSLFGLLGIALGSVTGQVGVDCTPISVIGLGSNSCTAQPVCCTNNHFNGLIVVGCTPVNLNA